MSEAEGKTAEAVRAALLDRLRTARTQAEKAGTPARLAGRMSTWALWHVTGGIRGRPTIVRYLRALVEQGLVREVGFSRECVWQAVTADDRAIEEQDQADRDEAEELESRLREALGDAVRGAVSVYPHRHATLSADIATARLILQRLEKA